MLPSMIELMYDPELVQSFQIVHRAFTVNADRTTTASDVSTESAVGVVVPASPKALDVLPQGTRLQDVLRVFTRADVNTGDGKTTLSDVIVFDGFRWVVFTQNNWTHNGFVEVTAVRNDVV